MGRESGELKNRPKYFLYKKTPRQLVSAGERIGVQSPVNSDLSAGFFTIHRGQFIPWRIAPSSEKRDGTELCTP